MKQTVRAAARGRANPVLRIASSPREAWDGIISDWFRATAPAAWKQPLPSLVVVPTRSHAQAFKARLLERGESHLGLLFVTPITLRGWFAVAAERAPAAREDLRLLLALAAEETLGGQETKEPDDERQAANAVLRAPDHLLRTLDRLHAAGWKFDDLQLPSFQPIVRRFREHLRAARLDLVAEVDRLALERSAGEPPLFAHLLVTGFDGAHWPFWFLLRAAVQAAESATVVLEYPHGDSTADSCWIGSWEDAFSEATDVSSQANASLGDFFTDEEMRGLGRAKSDCSFLVGADTSEQAEAVAFQCLRFLSEPRCHRMGLVFAEKGSLPRLVASALAKLEIPHNDAIGHPLPGVFESGEWRTWLALQRSPRINSLLHFINALPKRADLFPALSSGTFERKLRAAHAEVLIDDLDILQQFCAEQSGADSEEISTALRSLDFLPARALLSEFLGATQAAFKRLEWKSHWMEITRRCGDWIEGLDVEFSRALYLRWLEEIASTFSASRDAAGDHPYARVQLLTVPQALGQEWSHLIFAGWNEGSWPPPASAEFAREDEIAAFNRGIQKLNRRAARQGRQGEGHSAIRDPQSLYLGPSEQRQIALRQFDALANSASAELAFTASLAQENTPDRLWNPSELFTRFYLQTHRKPLTQAAMSSVQRATAAWLENARTLKRKTELPSVQIEQTRVAFDARREPLTRAGEYDFAFRSAPSRVPRLSVSEIEKLVKTPAQIWLKKYLGVKAPDEGSTWQSATGIWAHDWLASIGGASTARTFTRLPEAPEIDKLVRRAAEKKSAEVKRLCASAGKPVPAWWTSGWQNALFQARYLGSKIATAQEWPWMATEWIIDPDEPVTVAEGSTLSFSGRIDLLLAQNEPTSKSEASEFWIIDYKTGANKALAPEKADAEKRSTRLHNRLVKGEALQLGLYALAMRQRGATEVFLSIISRTVRSVTAQLSLSDIAAHGDVFAELARMQQTGVFGMYGQLRPAFGFACPYPLATLTIDPDLLDAKWELTHPALAREEEEWDY